MKKLFCYLFDFGSVSSGSTYTVELPFASNSDFQIRQIKTNLSDTTEGKVSIKKEDGEDISNSGFELRAIAGASNPLNVFDDVIVPKGSKWTASVVVSAGAAQPLQLQLWGVKL